MFVKKNGSCSLTSPESSFDEPPWEDGYYSNTKLDFQNLNFEDQIIRHLTFIDHSIALILLRIPNYFSEAFLDLKYMY